MPTVELNYWAILVGGASNMIIGYIWYSMPVFGRSWINLIGKTEQELKAGSGRAIGVMVVLALITSFVMAHFVDYTNATSFMDGVITGVWVWLGFVATEMISTNIFAGRPLKLSVITTGFQLVGLAIMGGILAAWK